MPSDMYPAALGDILADETTKAEYQLIDCREKDELSRADIRGAGFLLLPISEFQQVRHTDTDKEARQYHILHACI
jgi:rhodanese-related sulfurtransferase